MRLPGGRNSLKWDNWPAPVTSNILNRNECLMSTSACTIVVFLTIKRCTPPRKPHDGRRQPHFRGLFCRRGPPSLRCCTRFEELNFAIHIQPSHDGPQFAGHAHSQRGGSTESRWARSDDRIPARG